MDAAAALDLISALGLHIPEVYARDVASKWSIRNSKSSSLGQGGKYRRFTWIFQCICGSDHTVGPNPTVSRQMPFENVGCNAFTKLVVTFEVTSGKFPILNVEHALNSIRTQLNRHQRDLRIPHTLRSVCCCHHHIPGCSAARLPRNSRVCSRAPQERCIWAVCLYANKHLGTSDFPPHHDFFSPAIPLFLLAAGHYVSVQVTSARNGHLSVLPRSRKYSYLVSS